MASCHVCGKTYNHDRPRGVAQATKCPVCGDQSMRFSPRRWRDEL